MSLFQRIPAAIVLIVILAAHTGCSATSPQSEIGSLYNRSARQHDAERNPVIVIPGILGSRLEDRENGTVIWGSFTGSFSDPDTPEGARMVALPFSDSGGLNAVHSSAYPAGVLDTVHLSLLGLPIELHAYHEIMRTLGIGGFRDMDFAAPRSVQYGEGHFTCFQFPYDWRRDVSYNAVLLDQFILEKKRYVERQLRERYGIEREVKFNIVAHSMGGLLARYYLRYGGNPLSDDGAVPLVTWAGARNVENAVLIGTPNSGSILALHDLLYGKKLSPITPAYDAAILGSMPALYELLPRPRHGVYEVNGAAPGEQIDIYDPAVWERMHWGLANPELERALERLLPHIGSASERREIARRHLERSLARAQQFHDSLDSPAEPPPHLTMNTYIGDAMPTLTAFINPRNGSVTLGNPVPGDGVVTRSSALGDERSAEQPEPHLLSPVSWQSVTFLFTDHLGLTQDPVFVDNILHTLLERPQPRNAVAVMARTARNTSRIPSRGALDRDASAIVR